MRAKYKPFGIIYKATAPDGRCYVGQTTQGLAVRRRQHEQFALRQDEGGCASIATGLREFGISAFRWEVLAAARDAAELDALEKEWILRLNCVAPNGFNLHIGGGGKKSDCPVSQLRRIRGRLIRAMVGRVKEDRKRLNAVIPRIHKAMRRCVVSRRIRVNAAAKKFCNPFPFGSKAHRAQMSATWTAERRSEQTARAAAMWSDPDKKSEIGAKIREGWHDARGFSPNWREEKRLAKAAEKLARAQARAAALSEQRRLREREKAEHLARWAEKRAGWAKKRKEKIAARAAREGRAAARKALAAARPKFGSAKYRSQQRERAIAATQTDEWRRNHRAGLRRAATPPGATIALFR